MKSNFFWLITGLVLGMAGTAPAAVINDPFTSLTFDHRTAGRGPWKIANGVASCTQDDAIYRQSKDHGPILKYDTNFTGATVHFAFQAEKVKALVFTFNGEKEHAFRFVLAPDGLSVRAGPPPTEEGRIRGVPVKGQAPKLEDGKWTEVAVQLQGDQVTLSIGAGFKETFQSPGYAQKIISTTIGFSFGTLSVKDLKIEPNAPAEGN